MICSEWICIENQNDLDSLNSNYEWHEEVEFVEFVGLLKNESYFPIEISRSGRNHPNIHIILEISASENHQCTLLEFVLIACESFDNSFLEQPHFSGKVDSLKRVIVEDQHHQTRMSCARLMYRTVQDNRLSFNSSSYFKFSDSIS